MTVHVKPPVTSRQTQGAGQRNRQRERLRSRDFSAAHHAQGNHVNAPSAPSQLVAPQQIIQPLRDAIRPTRMEWAIDKFLPRASMNPPAARTQRCPIASAAACWEKISGNFQMQTMSALMKMENTPY